MDGFLGDSYGRATFLSPAVQIPDGRLLFCPQHIFIVLFTVLNNYKKKKKRTVLTDSSTAYLDLNFWPCLPRC